MAFPLTPDGRKVIPTRPPPGGDQPQAFAKGGNVKEACYANGGPVLGRTQDFMKSYDRFRGGKPKLPEGTEDTFTKTGTAGKLAEPKGETKVLKAVKPRG